MSDPTPTQAPAPATTNQTSKDETVTKAKEFAEKHKLMDKIKKIIKKKLGTH